MPVRYPLLFSNIHSYRFLRKYPFIPSGYAISFYIEHSLARTLPRRFTHKAASAFFPLPFLHSFDREQAGQPHIDTPYTPIVGAPSVEIHRKSSPMGWSDGIPACAVSILPVNGMFPIPGCSSRLHAGISRPLCCQADNSFRTKLRHDSCSSRLFRYCFSIEVIIIIPLQS